MLEVELTVRLRALQDFAISRKRMVLARATVAAPLIASISMSPNPDSNR